MTAIYFIKLTDVYDSSVFVQISAISHMYENGRGGSYVHFNGREEDCISVQDSTEQILAKMKDIQGGNNGPR